LRQGIYQIVAGYEDANDADRLRHDPMLQIVADRKLGHPLGSHPTLSRWENAPCARDLVHLNDALVEQFIRLCGEQVRKRGEILLDLDSTDDPTHGQQQLSFFNGAYGQHMYHPMLIFERHTGCLLAARLRPGNASSHARIVPMPVRLVPPAGCRLHGFHNAIFSDKVSNCCRVFLLKRPDEAFNSAVRNTFEIRWNAGQCSSL
jgi:Transposase DDE domain group 1